MDCTRRVFLTTASGVVVSTRMAAASVQGANNRVRVGIIGTGGRARGLMNQLKGVSGVEIVAVCDVFEQRLLQAAEIAGPSATKTAEYRRILDDKGIDAVLIGSPDHWHKKMTLDAVAAGKDVYVEKPVSHTIEEGAEMVRVIEASKQVVQTGTQQRSWEHYLQGKEIVQSGKLGQITFVQAPGNRGTERTAIDNRDECQRCGQCHRHEQQQPDPLDTSLATLICPHAATLGKGA